MRIVYEENVPTVQAQESQQARVPSAGKYEGRSGGAETTAPQGQEAPDRFGRHLGLCVFLRHRFPKGMRIRSSREISLLLRTGQRWQCPLFRVVYSCSQEGNRYVVLLSRHHGSATKRNRLKRVFREVIRLNERGIPPFYNAAVLPRVGATWKFSEVQLWYRQWQGHTCIGGPPQ